MNSDSGVVIRTCGGRRVIACRCAASVSPVRTATRISGSFSPSAAARMSQQEAAQRGARVLELPENREVVVRGHVERLAGQAPGAPYRGHFLTLAVILGSLELADGEQQRSRARRRAVHRAQAARRLRRELQ